VSAQTALPATGSEGGLAAIAAILVTTGFGLTMLSKRRGTQQA
jgi:LPXTG-motif cell wall-anchored protein